MNIELVNSVALLEIKIQVDGHANQYERQLNRIHAALEEEGYQYICPLGQPYRETQTDVEATIGGEGLANLKIIQVVKPIIYYQSKLVQKGIVIVG